MDGRRAGAGGARVAGKGSGPAFYLRHAPVAAEEGPAVEFKAHRCLSDLDTSRLDTQPGRDGGRRSKWRARRCPLSPYICGMLNKGRGGTFFLGVCDDGRVGGLHMSQFQQDHFLLSLTDLMSCYTPKVPPNMYRVRFVPVLDSATEKPPPPCERGPMDQIDRDLPHEIRESRYCWCDCDAMAAMERGLLHPFYLVELEILPWDPGHPGNAALVCPAAPWVPPVFQNERGLCYIRGLAGTQRVGLKGVGQIVTERVKQPRNQDSGLAESESDLEIRDMTQPATDDCDSVESYPDDDYASNFFTKSQKYR